MKVRTRIVLSFAYVLLVIAIALTVPLAIVLRDRARSELEALALTNAQTIATSLDADRLGTGPPRERLSSDVERFAADIDGRVVVLDGDGVVLADSDEEDVGQDFATPGRPEVRQALDSVASAGVRTSTDEGGEIVVAAVPVTEAGALVGVVRVSRDVAQVQRAVTTATAAIVAVATAALIASLVLAFVLARSLARPLSRLATTARSLGKGDLEARAGRVEGGEELEELARSFDEMAERLERTMRAQRSFVANASHQLRTPLTGMKLRLEAAIADTTDPAVRSQLLALDTEVDRLASIVDGLLTLARETEEGRETHVDLAEAAGRAVERWHDRAARASARLSTYGDPVVALANPDDVDQVLDVVLDNALSYAPGPIDLRTDAAGNQATLRITDHGPGIAPDDLPRVTERFYRGRGGAAGGSGLGLAIAKELVERWGGTLSVGADDGGASVEIRFRTVEV